MRSVILTDTHLGIKNSNKEWLQTTYDLFIEVADYCNRNNINKIIHLGDWFNSRYSINVLAIECSYNIIKMLKKNGIHLYICIGNHDTYFKQQQEPHSLMIFNKHDNVTIIDKPIEFDDEVICPWGVVPEQTDKKILMGHYEINGIVTNKTGHELTSAKLSISDFKKFDKVLSGHFHTKSVTGNIEYIGSSFAMDFNDINSERGYYCYEGGELTEFIEYSGAAKFKQFTSEDDYSNIDIKGNICKLIFSESYSDTESAKIIEKVRMFEPKELHVDFKIETEETTEEELFIGTNSEIIQHYIFNIMVLPDGLDKDILGEFIHKLENELIL